MFGRLSTTDLAIIAVALDEELEDSESEECENDKTVDELKQLRKIEEIKKFERMEKLRLMRMRERNEKKKTKNSRRSRTTNITLAERRCSEFYLVYKKLLDNETKFYQHFSVSLHQFHDVLSKIETVIRRKDTVFKTAITPNEKLAVCLRFLTTGSSTRKIASDYKLGFSTVWTIVRDVCNAIIDKMLHEQMPLLRQGDWENIADNFWRLWNFPNCVGVLGGKRIQINKYLWKSVKYENESVREVSLASVELFSLVNAQCKFIMVDTGTYRDKTDEDLFGSSDLATKLKYELAPDRLSRPFPNSNEPMPFIVIDDLNLSSESYLLKPYLLVKEDESKKCFNRRWLNVRKVVDDAFDALTRKFRIYNKMVKSNPQSVREIVLTTCILHNYIGNFDKTTDYGNANHFSCLKNIPSGRNCIQDEAHEFKDAFKHFLFVNQDFLPET